MVGVDTQVFHGIVNCGASGVITGIGNVLPREVLRLVELCQRAAKGEPKARRLALELEGALAPLSVFDEGVDLVLYFKRLMTLQGHEEYALQLNAFDVLSPSQETWPRDGSDVPRLVCVMARSERTERDAGHRILHTEGEPTRVIVEGGPPLGDGPIARIGCFHEILLDDSQHAVLPVMS